MMVNRIRTALNIEAERPDQKDRSSLKHTSRRHNNRNNQPSDDLIVALANAYENKRARQSVEWERLGHQASPIDWPPGL